MSSFISIDVETANDYRRSICQVGIAKFIDGKITREWSTLIDPETNFGQIQTSIHGIKSSMVVGKPKMPEVAEQIRSFLESGITVCHSFFDHQALFRSFEFYNLKQIATTWLNTEEVARRAWNITLKDGCKLSNLCDSIGHKFNHHDALEDAKAAGYILLAAIHKSKTDLASWIKQTDQPRKLGPALQEDTTERFRHPAYLSKKVSYKRTGNPNGKLLGEFVVFTGDFENDKGLTADIAANAGCEVRDTITTKTTILVIGTRDASAFGGREKSGKQIQAEERSFGRNPIQIISESEFKALVKSN